MLSFHIRIIAPFCVCENDLVDFLANLSKCDSLGDIWDSIPVVYDMHAYPDPITALAIWQEHYKMLAFYSA